MALVITVIDYGAVALIGALVGIGELVARYRDAPNKALTSYAAVLYITINALAATTALALIRVFGWDFQIDQANSANALRISQILLAGFGAMALFRSSLFLVRVGNEDIGVGPSGFLQIVLSASDRAVDRLRGEQRSGAVNTIMQGISYSKAKTALPTYCLALMQNLPAEDQVVFGDQLAQLDKTSMDDHTKALSLGLLIMNFMGEDVLSAAVHSLRPVIAGEAEESDGP